MKIRHRFAYNSRLRWRAMSQKKSERLGFHEPSRREVWITLSGVGLALFMASLDQTIVATAMPRIVRELGGFESYSGTVTAYMIASTAVMPIVGKLSDIHGRKFFLLGGILWFTAASVLCGLAQTMPWLIACRALQGLGAGTMTCAASTTIADLFPPSERGRVIGILVPITGVSSVMGPLLGGFLTDGPGWRYVFYVNLPIGLLGCAVLARYAPNLRSPKPGDFRVDYAGVAALVASVVPLLMALNGIDKDHPWFSPRVLGLGVVGLLFGLAFLWIETKAAHPILPLELFKNSIVSISLLSAALASASLLGVTFFLPLFVQQVLGANARTSGAILLPFTLTFMAMVAVTGHLISRWGRYRVFAILGPATAVAGGFLLARLGPSTTHPALVAAIVIVGAGLALCMPVYNLATQNAVPLGLLGSATSMVNFMRAIGSSLGMAVFGSILTARSQSAGIAPALGDIFRLILLALVVTLVLAFFLEELPLRKTTAARKAVPEDLE
jgi:EmrB/QacA subfamily drug resistance transporter